MKIKDMKVKDMKVGHFYEVCREDIDDDYYLFITKNNSKGRYVLGEGFNHIHSFGFSYKYGCEKNWHSIEELTEDEYFCNFHRCFKISSYNYHENQPPTPAQIRKVLQLYFTNNDIPLIGGWEFRDEEGKKQVDEAVKLIKEKWNNE